MARLAHLARLQSHRAGAPAAAIGRRERRSSDTLPQLPGRHGGGAMPQIDEGQCAMCLSKRNRERSLYLERESRHDAGELWLTSVDYGTHGDKLRRGLRGADGVSAGGECTEAGERLAGADFRDASYEDFLASAAAIGPVFAESGSEPLGCSIRRAVEATVRHTRSNTNLGIVLLLAPLARAARMAGERPLRDRLAAVLAATTVADARETFAAIRLANPGGLGHVRIAGRRRRADGDAARGDGARGRPRRHRPRVRVRFRDHVRNRRAGTRAGARRRVTVGGRDGGGVSHAPRRESPIPLSRGGSAPNALRSLATGL